jgi:hypothetical protein
VKVDAVLSAAQHRENEWRAVREAIPSLDLHPQLAEELGEPEITIDRKGWELLVAVDGRRTVHAIARKLKLTEFDTCRLLKTLIDAGAVVLPEEETRRATRSAARDPHDDPKPPLRISSKDPGAAANGKVAPAKPGVAASKAASNDNNADKAKKAAAASDGDEARDGKRSRLPTVGRLRRRED